MMKFLALFALVAVASASTVDSDVISAFQAFQEKYGKEYESSEEWTKRLGVFADNLERVAQLNKEHILLGGDAVHGITKFSDLTKDEFKAMYLTYKPSNHDESTRVTPKAVPNNGTVDWRTQGVLTPVKDQGQCGSCWAFSTTEAVESYAKMSGKYDLIKLSPQQINSCDKVDQGCNGGNTETAYAYLQKAGGLEDAASYPYTSGTGITGICKFNAADVKVKISGYKSVAQGETNLHAAVTNGPASVCLAAEAFQTYTSGILKVCLGQIDHCVQAVGYDDNNNPPYWIVRNSWNTDWGEQGFIRIEQGKNLCKIANDATYPTF